MGHGKKTHGSGPVEDRCRPIGHPLLRQPHRYRRAEPWTAVDAQRSAMAFRQSLAERKPEPGSPEAAGISVLQLTERFQRPWYILGRHSDAAVDHLKDGAAVLLR